MVSDVETYDDMGRVVNGFVATSGISEIALFDHDMYTRKTNLEQRPLRLHLGVSKNNGTPKSSINRVFIINHPFWAPLFLETSIWGMSKRFDDYQLMPWTRIML